MAAISVTVVQEFCKLCNWVYEAWAMHRAFFDDNTNADFLKASQYGDSLARLSIITQEYVLLQIVKLHDRAVQREQINLTLEYMVKFGGWDEITAGRLRKLHEDLETLAKKLRPARNKVLSHNDLSAILESSSLGEFEKGADIKYFEALQEFANVVYDKVIGGPFPFNDLAVNDANALLAALTDDDERLMPN